MHTIDNSYIGADGARPDPRAGLEPGEFAVVWEQSGLTALYTPRRASAAACVWPFEFVGATPSAEDAVAADIDGDGDRDVLVCMEGLERRVTAFINDENAGFVEHTFDLPPFKWMVGAPMDLDADGRADLVVGGRFVTQNTQGAMAWLQPGENAAAFNEWNERIIADAGWPMALLAMDMDGDGDDDIVVADRFGATRGLKWVENPAPNFDRTPWNTHFIGLATRRARAVAAADMDGDGDIDFIAPYERVNNTPHGMIYLENTGAGWTETPLPMPATIGVPKAIVIEDFNLDGRLDFALTCELAYDPLIGVCVYVAGEDGWIIEDVSGPAGCKFDVLTAVDLDDDGDLDLVTTEEGDNGALPALGVIWYENPVRRPGPIGEWLRRASSNCDLPRPAWLNLLDAVE